MKLLKVIGSEGDARALVLLSPDLKGVGRRGKAAEECMHQLTLRTPFCLNAKQTAAEPPASQSEEVAAEAASMCSHP